MSSQDTLTLKNALVGQLLGDVDSLVTRVEAVPLTFESANKALAFTVKALDESGDRYRLAVTASTEEARTELLDFIKRKSSEKAAESTAEQRLAIADAAKHALRSETTAAVTKALRTSLSATLDEALAKVSGELRQPLWVRLLEHSFTALLASALTATMLYLVHAR